MIFEMSWHTQVSAVACAGHLAFAWVLWSRRGKGNIAQPLALLFLDTFVWTFADLAYALTHASEWHWLDHAFSSFLPAFAVEVIAAFVGKTRVIRRVRAWLFGVGAGIATLMVNAGLWWPCVLVYGLACGGYCGALLLEHLGNTANALERRRTKLLLLAVLLGTLLSLTDLAPDSMHVPKISNIGMLVSLSLVAACVLRLDLLGQRVPGLILSYALIGGVLLLVAGLVLARALPSRAGVVLLVALAVLAIAVSAVREIARVRAAEQERLERLVELGRFSEQLAHDLRNPLAALKGAAQFLIVERQKGRSIDGQDAFLSLMLEQIERTGRVVDAYQRLANVEAIKAPTSLNAIVEAVLGMQRFASTDRITVRARMGEQLPVCELDPELIQTTLENLLRNAFEAMPNGGGITVETCAQPGDAGAPGLSLFVIDEGEGMDARLLERATDQFFTTKASGSGLGLSYAARVAQAHQGRLDLTSQVGKGTTVRVWIPLHPV